MANLEFGVRVIPSVFTCYFDLYLCRFMSSKIEAKDSKGTLKLISRKQADI